MKNKLTRFNVQLNFTATVMGMPETAEIHHVQNMVGFDGYSDGRKQFLIEVIEDALRRQLRHAIDRAVNTHYRAIYGNEMVPTSSSGGTARAVLEADKDMEQVKVVDIYINEDDAAVVSLKE